MVSQSSERARKKVLAFFGSDLRRGTAHRFLQKVANQGYELLALDSQAMSLAREAKAPYRLVEDYIDPEALYQAHVEANECSLHWFEAGRDEFTVDGICWPELDKGALRYFWSNVTLAVKLAQAARRAEVEEFRFFRHFSPLPQIGSAKADVCQIVWETELPGIAKRYLTFDQLSVQRLVRGIKKVPEKFSLRQRLPVRQEGGELHSFPQQGIVIVMAVTEAFRFSDVVTGLSNQFPGKVGVVVTKSHPAVSDAIGWKESVPLRYGPVLPIESWMPGLAVRVSSWAWPGLARRFLRGYLSCVAHSKGTPWEIPLRALRFHFAHYCLYRWPMLQQSARPFWGKLWSRYRPAVVLVSSVADAPYSLAALEARHRHICTVGIPHGGVIGPPGHCIAPPNDLALYSAVSQEGPLKDRGVPASALVPCRNLVAHNEYRMAKASAFSASEKLRVLALTDTTDEGTNLAKLVGLDAQRTALRVLAEPPPDLVERVDVKIKVHPNFSDLSMMSAVSPALVAKIIPARADLHRVLEETDLVVAVNYYGSALIHALRAGKPVVYLLTVQESLAKSRLNLFWLFRDATEVAHTGTAFWHIVQSFVSDHEFAQAMQKKAEEFARTSLDDSHYPEITELMESLLRRCSDRRPSP